MKSKIGIAKVSFEQISLLEQRTIMGGDLVDDLLANIFVKDTGVSQPLFDIFVSNLRDIATTSTGTSMLSALLNNGTQIHISGAMPSDPSAGAQYIPSSHTVRIGNYDPDNTSILNFDNTAHELYHAYEQLVQGSPSTYFHDVKSELDACIFSRMLDVQFDQNHNIDYNDTNSHIRRGIDISGTNTSQNLAEHQAFKTAWLDIFDNHNFSTANYNTLINNFVLGSFYVSQPTVSSNTVTDLSSVLIDDLFSANFSNYYIHPPSNSGNAATNNLYNNFNPNNFSLYDNDNRYYIAASSYWNPSPNNSFEDNMESFLNSCLAAGVTVKYNDVIICYAGPTNSSNGGSANNNAPNQGNSTTLQNGWGYSSPANFFNTFGLFIYSYTPGSNTSSNTTNAPTNGSGNTNNNNTTTWNGAIDYYLGGGSSGLDYYFTENGLPLSPEQKAQRGLPCDEAY